MSAYTFAQTAKAWVGGVAAAVTSAAALIVALLPAIPDGAAKTWIASALAVVGSVATGVTVYLKKNAATVDSAAQALDAAIQAARDKNLLELAERLQALKQPVEVLIDDLPGKHAADEE